MPILKMHLKADEELIKRTDIKQRNDFVLGSIFPDAMWEDDPDKWSKLSDELHCPVFGKCNLRYPSYISFLSRYKYFFASSDFMKGILFHLLLDCINNIEWDRKVKSTGNENFILYTDFKEEKPISGIKELLGYKYGDMERWLHYNPCSVIIPTSYSENCRNMCWDIFEIHSNVLDIICAKSNEYKANVLPYKDLKRPIFTDAYYIEIINKAVDTYKRIEILERWS